MFLKRLRNFWKFPEISELFRNFCKFYKDFRLDFNRKANHWRIMCESIPAVIILIDWRARYLTIIEGTGGGVICQQKLPAGPGICPIFSNARGLLAAGIDSHIMWYLDFKEVVK